MKKRYAYTFSVAYHVLAATLVIILSASFIVNVLKLTQTGNLRSYNVPLDITACVALPVMALLTAAFIWGSGYTFSDKKLYINLGPVVRGIDYADIVKVRRNEEKTILIVYYFSPVKEDGDERPAWKVEKINIRPAYYDDFASALVKLSDRAEYDIVTKEDSAE